MLTSVMESLADFLGIRDIRNPDASKPPEVSFRSVKDFCRGVLRSQEYRESVMRRILFDELPPQIEVLFFAYAEGKPIDRIEVKDTTDDIDEMNAEQCEQEAMRLLELARQLKEEDASDQIHAARVH